MGVDGRRVLRAGDRRSGADPRAHLGHAPGTAPAGAPRLRSGGLKELEGERLSRAAARIPRDDPAEEYLRHRNFLAGREFPPEFATTREFYPTLLATFKAAMPLVRFLNEPLVGAKDLWASGCSRKNQPLSLSCRLKTEAAPQLAVYLLRRQLHRNTRSPARLCSPTVIARVRAIDLHRPEELIALARRPVALHPCGTPLNFASGPK